MTIYHLAKVVSGGQSGVDRAALDAAIQFEITCGGWCPPDRWAEDGPIDKRYPLEETVNRDISVRTELNVIDSDGTLVLTTTDAPSDGTSFTLTCIAQHSKPHKIVNLDSPVPPDEVYRWLIEKRIKVLNVAGPRESHRPGIVYAKAFQYLSSLFTLLTRKAPGAPSEDEAEQLFSAVRRFLNRSGVETKQQNLNSIVLLRLLLNSGEQGQTPQELRTELERFDQGRPGSTVSGVKAPPGAWAARAKSQHWLVSEISRLKKRLDQFRKSPAGAVEKFRYELYRPAFYCGSRPRAL